MKKIIITIEAETQFHNGQDYQYYPALKITATDAQGERLLIPRTTDIHDAQAFDTLREAQQAAEIFLGGNVEAIGRVIIAEVNE